MSTRTTSDRMEKPASTEVVERGASSHWDLLDEYGDAIAGIDRETSVRDGFLLRYWNKDGERLEKRFDEVIEAGNWASENVWAQPVVFPVSATTDGVFRSNIALTRDHKHCVGHVTDWGNGHSVAIWYEDGQVQVDASDKDLLAICRHIRDHADLPTPD